MKNLVRVGVALAAVSLGGCGENQKTLTSDDYERCARATMMRVEAWKLYVQARESEAANPESRYYRADNAVAASKAFVLHACHKRGILSGPV